MKGMGRAVFRWSPVRWFGFGFDYDPKLVEAMKPLLPIRAWDPMSKTWWVPETFYGITHSLAQQYVETTVPLILKGADPALSNTQQSPAHVRELDAYNRLGIGNTAPPIWRADDPYARLGLHRQAPDCVVEAAFKAMAKELDPERSGMGGSYEPFEALREAYFAIQADRGRSVAP